MDGKDAFFAMNEKEAVGLVQQLTGGYSNPATVLHHFRRLRDEREQRKPDAVE